MLTFTLQTLREVIMSEQIQDLFTIALSIRPHLSTSSISHSLQLGQQQRLPHPSIHPSLPRPGP